MFLLTNVIRLILKLLYSPFNPAQDASIFVIGTVLEFPPLHTFTGSVEHSQWLESLPIQNNAISLYIWKHCLYPDWKYM